MREFQEKQQGQVLQVACNCCGRQLLLRHGMVKEECIDISHSFGYFSRKDGIRHHFHLCEDCYDRWIAAFAIPVEQTPETELLGGSDFPSEDGCPG